MHQRSNHSHSSVVAETDLRTGESVERLSVSLIKKQRRDPDISFWLQMRRESRRLETFFDFPNEDSEVIEDLAENGFFYTGEFDRVMCAFCDLVLHEWEPLDVPKFEHRRHCPECPFVCGQDVGNVPMIQSVQNSGERSVAVPEFSTRGSRLRTYNKWPRSTRQHPVELATAGFYYLGDSDRVRCFSCGGILSGWLSNESPFDEHLLSFPHCSFAQEAARTRADYEERQELKKNNSHASSYYFNAASNEVYQSNSGTDVNTTTSSPITTGKEEELSREFERLLEARVCSVCMDKEKNSVFLPCGHVTCCTNCATQLNLCPLCRNEIAEIIPCVLP